MHYVLPCFQLVSVNLSCYSDDVKYLRSLAADIAEGRKTVEEVPTLAEKDGCEGQGRGQRLKFAKHKLSDSSQSEVTCTFKLNCLFLYELLQLRHFLRILCDICNVPRISIAYISAPHNLLETAL